MRGSGACRSAIVAAVLVAGAACSSFSSAPVESPDSGADAPSGTDGDGSGGDGGAVDASLGVNLVSNGDFELGCAGWSVNYGASNDISDVTHGGKGACRICGDPGLTYTLYRRVDLAIPAGAEFYAEAYIHAAVIKGPPKQIDTHFVFYANPDVTTPSTTTNMMTTGWTKVSTLATSSTAADAIELQIQTADTDTCFVVDDITLYRTK